MKTYEVAELVWSSALEPHERLVLLRVAFFANGTAGVCTAATATIARDTGLAVRTVRRILDRLVELGALTSTPVHGRPTVYQVSPIGVTPPLRVTPTPPLRVTPATDDPGRPRPPTPPLGVTPGGHPRPPTPPLGVTRSDQDPDRSIDRSTSVGFEDTPTQVDEPDRQTGVPYTVHGVRHTDGPDLLDLAPLVNLEREWAEQVEPEKVHVRRWTQLLARLTDAVRVDGWTVDELEAWWEECADRFRIKTWAFFLGPKLAEERRVFRDEWSTPREPQYRGDPMQDPAYRAAYEADIARRAAEVMARKAAK